MGLTEASRFVLRGRSPIAALCVAPLELFRGRAFTQGDARSELAMGWLAAGPLARGGIQILDLIPAEIVVSPSVH